MSDLSPMGLSPAHQAIANSAVRGGILIGFVTGFGTGIATALIAFLIWRLVG